ncbi:MAG: hypothetical protein ACTSUE_24830 [Promethearchaeota archaeon]
MDGTRELNKILGCDVVFITNGRFVIICNSFALAILNNGSF